MDSIGARLRESRQRRALSQDGLAELSGVPKVTISRIENNRYGTPRPSTARKLQTRSASIRAGSCSGTGSGT